MIDGWGIRYNGMIRRLEIACPMLIKPKIMFLDEPTIGLDPAARKVVWERLGVFKEGLLKERFGKEIVRVYGVRVECVNVYMRYVRLDRVGVVRHILKYAFRLPIEDLAPHLKGGLSDEVKGFVLSVLNYPHKRIRWFGFWLMV